MERTVRVRFYATLRALVGAKTVEIGLPDGATVLDLAHALAERHPALAEPFFGEGAAARGEAAGAQGEGASPDTLARSVHFMLDGRNVRWLPEGERTVLQPGHEIDVFPPVAGG